MLCTTKEITNLGFIIIPLNFFQKWRPFCEKFKTTVEDYSFGTLIRIDSDGEYSEENSMLTTRIQFYAIELSRNREGCNDGVRIKYKPSKKKKQS